MAAQSLHDQAHLAGLEVLWHDVRGNVQEVSGEVLQSLLRALGPEAANPETLPSMITGDAGRNVPVAAATGAYSIRLEDGTVSEGFLTPDGAGNSALPPIHTPGYHVLEVAGREIRLAIAPPRCWTIADATAGHKAWGLAVQLYSLRRPHDGGLGDFVALRDLAVKAAAAGATALAVSPLHALFASEPRHFSPYSPSSRTMLNVLYGAPACGLLPDPAVPGDDLVDWPEASRLRLAVFRQEFAGAKSAQTALWRDFEQFRAAQGVVLQRHAIFEALHEALSGADAQGWNWRCWPAGFRDPGSQATTEFAAANADAVEFHAFLQFLADRDLGAAQRACRDAGMPIGLISDIAVGVAPHGSETWSRPREMLSGLTVGAPPDIFSPEGQNWGVTTFSPHGLVQGGFQAFIDMLRVALRHSGGVRLDHVMGLSRLWVVPEGAAASQGAYLRFPRQDMIRLVKLESWRHRAIILGEDLGTVPDGFQQELAEDGIAGLRVLWFERHGNRFDPPTCWSAEAAAMTSTHDLPTIAGWWAGRDLAWRETLGLLPIDFEARQADRNELWSALESSGSAEGSAPDPQHPEAVVDAACAHIAAAACSLALMPLEDVVGTTEQPNLPNTIDEHPNWRRRVTADVGTILGQPEASVRIAALARRRPRQSPP